MGEEEVGEKAAEKAAEKPYEYSSRVTFATPEHALMVSRALSVDQELHPANVQKVVKSEGNDVLIHFCATDPKMLRGAVGTFTDLLGVAATAIEMFGDQGAKGGGQN